MPFVRALANPDLLARIRRFRQRPIRVFGVAFGLVAAATLLRLALHQELSTTAPFTTYGLAVLCMALAGGFWPGMATLAASLAAGSILFLPPAFSFSLGDGAGWTLSMFALFGSINVVLISGLMASILAHDEHQQFLFGELQHRSRNLFTVVQSIVSRTLIESQSPAEAKQSVQIRLAALARAHAMLADSGWTGAALGKIISEELTSFGKQVRCLGCDVVLNTAAAQNFALIVHELATNAAKHGALSRPEGQIVIQGLIDTCGKHEMFRLTWTESGGPGVMRPQRKGFGTSILNGMAKRFAQTIEVNYRAEGLVYELQIPLRAIQASSRSPLGSSVSATTKSHSFGPTAGGYADRIRLI